MSEPASPCNSNCKINPDTGYCVGCKRTLDEIASWPYASADEKNAILQNVRNRQVKMIRRK